MPLVISKSSLDIGIVVHDIDAMIGFYRDVLGLPELGAFPLPGTVQHRYALGDSTIKLNVPDVAPTVRAPGGETKDATGIRYWTAFCVGLEDIVGECVAAGAPVVLPVTTSKLSGVRYALLKDPDGNCFELVEVPAP
jgi:catechol 2,3-dioxygenase-like lactoylglutathione lyase family enzyme